MYTKPFTKKPPTHTSKRTTTSKPLTKATKTTQSSTTKRKTTTETTPLTTTEITSLTPTTRRTTPTTTTPMTTTKMITRRHISTFKPTTTRKRPVQQVRQTTFQNGRGTILTQNTHSQHGQNITLKLNKNLVTGGHLVNGGNPTSKANGLSSNKMHGNNVGSNTNGNNQQQLVMTTNPNKAFQQSGSSTKYLSVSRNHGQVNSGSGLTKSINVPQSNGGIPTLHLTVQPTGSKGSGNLNGNGKYL